MSNCEIILTIGLLFISYLSAYKVGWHRGWRTAWNDYQAIVDRNRKDKINA